MSASLLAAWLLAIPVRAQGPAFDWPALRQGWRESVARVKASGRLPLIDILSSYHELSMNSKEFERELDVHGVAVAAFSPNGLEFWRWQARQVGSAPVDWAGALRRLSAAAPARYIPVPASDLDVAVEARDDAQGWLDLVLEESRRGGYPLLGEFRFRAYPTNTQAMAPRFMWADSDVDIPLDGPLGRRLFAFSQEHGVPFLLRYEPEDRLLPVLERMLAAYPGAKVIWRSAGWVAARDGSRLYGPRYLRRLLDTHRNLYVDLSGSDPRDVSPWTGQPASTLWDRRRGTLDPSWARLIADVPWRFLAALGLDHDHILEVGRRADAQRRLLGQLPAGAREIVAYKAAWKLLFGERLP